MHPKTGGRVTSSHVLTNLALSWLIQNPKLTLKDVKGKSFPVSSDTKLNTCTGTILIPHEICPVGISWSTVLLTSLSWLQTSHSYQPFLTQLIVIVIQVDSMCIMYYIYKKKYMKQILHMCPPLPLTLLAAAGTVPWNPYEALPNLHTDRRESIPGSS